MPIETHVKELLVHLVIDTHLAKLLEILVVGKGVLILLLEIVHVVLQGSILVELHVAELAVLLGPTLLGVISLLDGVVED